MLMTPYIQSYDNVRGPRRKSGACSCTRLSLVMSCIHLCEVVHAKKKHHHMDRRRYRYVASEPPPLPASASQEDESFTSYSLTSCRESTVV